MDGPKKMPTARMLEAISFNKKIRLFSSQFGGSNPRSDSSVCLGLWQGWHPMLGAGKEAAAKLS